MVLSCRGSGTNNGGDSTSTRTIDGRLQALQSMRGKSEVLPLGADALGCSVPSDTPPDFSFNDPEEKQASSALSY